MGLMKYISKCTFNRWGWYILLERNHYVKKQKTKFDKFICLFLDKINVGHIDERPVTTVVGLLLMQGCK